VTSTQLAYQAALVAIIAVLVRLRGLDEQPLTGRPRAPARRARGAGQGAGRGRRASGPGGGV